MPKVGVFGERPDQLLDLRQRSFKSFVVAGVLREEGKQMAVVLAGMPQPAGLTVEAEHRLHHRQTQQLRVTELRRASGQASDTDLIVIDLDVQCGHEGVQVRRHKRSWTPSLHARRHLDRLV
jgi:hypothetical protein